MGKLATRVSTATRHAADPGETEHLVVGVAVLMVAVTSAFRGWALYGSWFYLDDYNMLLEASRSEFGADYLLEPYNSHLMPGGRLLAWIVATSGQLDWPLAATLTLALQTLSGAAAVWMLLRVFGPRWGILAPLSIYLTTAVTLPATMWWTASLNQLPLQLGFFVAVGASVEYLRSRRLRWLAVCLLAVVLALSFYVKALLIGPVLGFIALAYFATGLLRDRLRFVVTTYWPALVAGIALTGAYLAYYISHVDPPFTETSPAQVGEMANTMLGTAFATGIVGGPWDWSALAPPNALASPPPWMVQLAWVLIALVALYAFLKRERTLRAWLLLAGYLAALLWLVARSRAPAFGDVIGLEYRYLTESACVVALCVGLVFLSVPGSAECSEPRDDPLLRPSLTWPAWTTVVAVICVSGLYSSFAYVDHWHNDNASDAYVHTLVRDLAAHGSVDLAEQAVPDAVIPGMFAPDNLLSRLVRLITADTTFPEWSPRLAAVGTDGTLRQARIDPGVVARPGKKKDCGWRVRETGRTIRLPGRAFEWVWWVRIGYLASEDSSVLVRAGRDRVAAAVQPGVNSLYVHVRGSFDTVSIDGLEPGVGMCVDRIEVGQVVPGEPLP